jgi:hypothetical protein
VDLSQNTDKYYVLQLVENVNSSSSSGAKGKGKKAAAAASFYVYSRWGRTGTSGLLIETRL